MNNMINGSWLLMTLGLPHIRLAFLSRSLQTQHSLIQNALSVERMGTGKEIARAITHLPLKPPNPPVPAIRQDTTGKKRV